jgi:Tfp pilus assembly protein PilX
MGPYSRQSKFSRFSKAFWRFFALSKESRPAVGHSNLKNSRGSALVMAAIFMLVATVLITVGVQLVANASRGAKEKELYVGEAENVARAGIIAAEAWFTRQSGNGVVSAYQQAYAPGAVPSFASTFTYVDEAFDPQGNTTNPQFADTIDQAIGLVSEYPLSDPVTANAVYWARYEVPQQGSGAMATTAVHDITGERLSNYVNGDGMVWSIQSTGYVYKRNDKTVDAYGNWIVPYNQAPNVVVAKAQFSTEFRKLGLNLPVPSPPGAALYSAGLYVNNLGQDVTLFNNYCLLNGAVSEQGSCAAIGLTNN